MIQGIFKSNNKKKLIKFYKSQQKKNNVQTKTKLQKNICITPFFPLSLFLSFLFTLCFVFVGIFFLNKKLPPIEFNIFFRKHVFFSKKCTTTKI